MNVKTRKLGDSAPEGGLSFVRAALSKMANRPAGLTYKAYSGMCKSAEVEALDSDAFKAMPVGGEMDLAKMNGILSKADSEEEEEAAEDSEEEEEEDSEEEEEEEMEMTHKSEEGISPTDLLKSIEAYDAVEDALREGGASRESFLVAKNDAGSLTKSERRELGRIWADEEENSDNQPEEMHKSLYDVVADDEQAGALVDASDFLKSLVSGVDVRMNSVSEEVGRQGRATRELLKAQGSLVKSLARIVAEQDNIIKSLAGRVETVEHAPAPRRSVSTPSEAVKARTLSKSVTGGENETPLSKSQITTGLRTMMLHASSERDDAAMDKITHATALYEQTGALPNNILAALKAV
jgi:hypothetical protein